MSKKNGFLSKEVEHVAETIRDVGFCVVPNLIPPKRCDEFRRVLMPILKEEKKQNLHHTGHQRILHLLVKNPIFTELLCHPFVLAVWRRYLCEDIICSTMTANALWPRSTELYWHVDHPYWTMTEPYPTYPLTGQVIWMIDDFTLANGATAGIRGSHRTPKLPRLAENWTDEATILTGSRGSAIFADGAWFTAYPFCCAGNLYSQLLCSAGEHAQAVGGDEESVGASETIARRKSVRSNSGVSVLIGGNPWLKSCRTGRPYAPERPCERD
jgi:hypothetical protein